MGSGFPPSPYRLWRAGRIQDSRSRIQDSGLKELINDMKIFKITKFNFLNNTPIGLREICGRQIFRKDYLAVSTVKRAAEGEI
jgi:hypothetical protein